jgi:hypothetical protein
MKVRAAILVLALLPVGAASTALATTKPKPKPVCNIVTDPTGDAAYNGAVKGEGNDDIVSADIASDGKTLTAVMRLAALDSTDPQSPLGHNYIISFSTKKAENVLFMAVRTYATGTKFLYGYEGSDPTLPLNISYPIGYTTGTVDLVKKEVRVSVPNAAFASQGTKFPLGTKVLGLTAQSYRMVGQGVVPSMQVGPQWVPLGGVSEQFDDASGGSYTVGTRSCVTPGK